MFPKINKSDVKPRSFSVNVDYSGMKSKAKRNISHYSYKIVEKLHAQPASNGIINIVPQKEKSGSLIIIIESVEDFLKEIAQNHKYQQFLKFKDFLNEKQITQFFRYIQNFLINLQSSMFEHHYCTFQLNKKPIDIVTADSKTVYEVITEFMIQHQKPHEDLHIYGGDFSLIHKSDFRQIIYVSEQRIEKQMKKEIKVNEKAFRFRTQIQGQVNDTNQDDILIDNRVYQIGMHKKNKEIKQYLQQQNNERRELNQPSRKSKELQIKKISGQTEKKIDLAQELPQICEQIYEKFKKHFQIEYISVDKELFSQFLLLCELSIQYSINLTLQQQITRFNEDNEKCRLLIKNVLYFEFKILKSMNLNLQQLQNCVTQALLKFINQDTKCQEALNKIYWNAFLRFKTFYIDQKWTTSDFRYFLLLLNEESPLTLQIYLQLPIRELSKAIFSLNEDLLQQIVWQILYTKQL
ncbi:unnamed protein product (macronuclear) [Paramecium tetraurelia]|uniref:Uncharacterized protein n=1 Tax=Paramecium tetraurelia TaxID=5888 RepID=A0CQR8_PARTE|nr:uncharacterized protein GSPATT00009483001 [Paramecium tetraurelia]CAK73135.1 unnamed protein product [Paramecium tetraurelia]|eukprot:XP_001440532.1 hypothetical protein (macronuclear) [Paramecium tetraurelia strain d4-2]